MKFVCDHPHRRKKIHEIRERQTLTVTINRKKILGSD